MGVEPDELRVTAAASERAETGMRVIDAVADGADTLLPVYATPRAGRSEVAGERQGSVWVRLAAPPVEGAANAALVRLLADRLAVPASRIRLIAGASSRQKRVRIAAMAPDEVRRRLHQS